MKRRIATLACCGVHFELGRELGGALLRQELQVLGRDRVDVVHDPAPLHPAVPGGGKGDQVVDHWRPEQLVREDL